jgi:NHL repeat
MGLRKRHREESTRERYRLRAVWGVVSLFAALLLVGLTPTAAASANISFTKAYGWGVLDGASQFETCTTTCQTGLAGGGAGEFDYPWHLATNSSGDVYVADYSNNRIDEFSPAGAFIEAYGWGVTDGASQFETCTTTCQTGLVGGGAGEFNHIVGVATDSSGDVYVADSGNNRIDEFSPAGAFIKAYGWGVADGGREFETCTTTCEAGHFGSAAGELDGASDVATDSSGDVYVADSANERIDEFSPAGAFIKAYGWGVLDDASQFETCTTTCQQGTEGSGAGQLSAAAGVAVDGSGDVYVADSANERIDEFSPAGAFIKAYGWGVADGASQFETCTTTCQTGLSGGGAGEFNLVEGVATDSSGDVYAADGANERIDEFSPAGAFIAAYGWGVADGANKFETCTSICQAGVVGGAAGSFSHPHSVAPGSSGGAGSFNYPHGVATDSSGDVYVADSADDRIEEFLLGGAPTTTSTSLSGGGRSGASISVTESTAVSDTATLSGTNASTATGTVTYRVYSNSGCTVVVSTGKAQSITTPGMLPASAAVKLSTPGTYYWQASYSGDFANAASMSTCGSEVETVTSPKVAPPVLGKSVDVAPVSGVVLVKQPGKRGFIRLRAGQRIPVRSTIDAIAGAISLTAAPAKSGTAHSGLRSAASTKMDITQSGTFGGAVFMMTQSTTGKTRGMTTLRLVEGTIPGGPSYSVCSAGARTAFQWSDPFAQPARAISDVIQTLKGRDHRGNFRTKGRFGATTVHRGTVWQISDRCDGTETTVRRGTATVYDYVNHKTTVVHAGHSFLAKGNAVVRN